MQKKRNKTVKTFFHTFLKLLEFTKALNRDPLPALLALKVSCHDWLSLQVTSKLFSLPCQAPTAGDNFHFLLDQTLKSINQCNVHFDVMRASVGDLKEDDLPQAVSWVPRSPHHNTGVGCAPLEAATNICESSRLR